MDNNCGLKLRLVDIFLKQFSLDQGQTSVFPSWVPVAAQRYLLHTVKGQSFRKLAKQQNCAPSTILRQIRKIENERDDPLMDGALQAFSTYDPQIGSKKETASMSRHERNLKLPDQITINAEARRILRRMSETDAILVVSAEMEMAVVLRCKDDVPVRTGMVSRQVAQAFALQDWISCTKKGRVHQYEITHTGRCALKRLLAQEAAAKSGAERVSSGFAEQHIVWENKEVSDPIHPGRVANVRVNLAESPLLLLARRKDKDGIPFLTEDLIVAAERLREDFELAQMGPRTGQNWDKFLTAGADMGFVPGKDALDGPSGARSRVHEALKALGPGLSDIVLRCCCHLEGLETAEKRMGWSARSGKIVLRIALQRLALHYETQNGGKSPMIG